MRTSHRASDLKLMAVGKRPPLNQPKISRLAEKLSPSPELDEEALL